ncbi:MAG TPA: hypothetical protein VMW24_03485, partial [Sedimentisphaerales bacterium]|nr:hypothetical protein [Sedimentisphaerales bacterium]
KEQFDKMLEDAMPGIVESFKRELKEKVDYQVQQRAFEVVQGYVVEWVQENVLPEIGKHLAESKDGIVKTGCDLAVASCEELSRLMVGDLKKNLEHSWNRTKIFEAMFK